MVKNQVGMVKNQVGMVKNQVGMVENLVGMVKNQVGMVKNQSIMEICQKVPNSKKCQKVLKSAKKCQKLPKRVNIPVITPETQSLYIRAPEYFLWVRRDDYNVKMVI